ncbi:MAG: MBL fold metallo-hydrolase [Methanophagales archaeon ANME-1-THS]|nr:MAG: MBL fold metallo-hydrolase [Methanophagales archaeon ANME-1-THS]
MIIQQFFVKGLAHSSYLLGGTKTCAVIDPQRDVELYLEAAKALDMDITHILETHLHADFVSGHLELADRTDAEIYVPKSAHCDFDHEGVAEGDTFELEEVQVRVLETPGHTPEHVSYVVSDRTRGDEPVSVFCGDTLFVGDVGRPDLFPGRAWELASELYESLHEQLLQLPDFCEVYPAHGAGSLCGRMLGAKRASTIGYERKYNPELRIADREKFITSLTTDMPPAPDHFSRCSEINRRGPALIRTLPVLEALKPKLFYERSKGEDTVVVDVRGYDSFGCQHVPGAFHIDFAGNFATFAGWVLPPDADILLVTESSARANEAVVWLRRVGLDRVIGYLDGGMFEWAKAGLPARSVRQLSIEALQHAITSDQKMVLLDVRAPSEYATYHIKRALNIPFAELRTRHTELDPGTPTTVICNTGHRSSLAASILKQHGFKEVCNVAGGMMGYNAAGYGLECPVCSIPHGPRFYPSERGEKEE